MAALNSAMQGAKLGGSFGGGWGAVAGGVLGLVLGSKADKQAEEATKKYNDQVVKFAAQDLFDLRRQQNVANIRTAQALSQYQANRKTQNSAVTASMGAADIIGSSAQALKQVMDYQTNEATAEVFLNFDTQVQSTNTAIERATNQRVGSLQRTTGQQGGTDFGALISGGVGLYEKYGSEGAGMVSDLKSTGASLMSSMRAVWETPSVNGATGLGNSSAIPSNVWDTPINTPTMKTFAL